MSGSAICSAKILNHPQLNFFFSYPWELNSFVTLCLVLVKKSFTIQFSSVWWYRLQNNYCHQKDVFCIIEERVDIEDISWFCFYLCSAIHILHQFYIYNISKRHTKLKHYEQSLDTLIFSYTEEILEMLRI